MRVAITLAVLFLLVLSVGLAMTEMPRYGEINPTFNYVYEHYILRGVVETGAVNVVAQILVDYRAYDTLIETVVLFSAIMAAILVLRSPHQGEESEEDHG